MIGDAMDMGEQTEEADDVYNQILGEIGMQMDSAGTVGTGAIASKIQAPAEEVKQADGEADDLEARLAAL